MCQGQTELLSALARKAQAPAFAPQSPPPPLVFTIPDVNIPKWDSKATPWVIYHLRFITWIQPSTFASISGITNTTPSNVHLRQAVCQKMVNTLPDSKMSSFLNDPSLLGLGFEMWEKVIKIESPVGMMATFTSFMSLPPPA